MRKRLPKPKPPTLTLREVDQRVTALEALCYALQSELTGLRASLDLSGAWEAVTVSSPAPTTSGTNMQTEANRGIRE